MKILIVILFFSTHCFAQTGYVIIKTPKGTNVTADTLVGDDLSATEKNDIKNLWLNYYNHEIEYLGEATYKYNCHAYAWHMTKGGDNVWLPDPEEYWNDTSYVDIQYPEEANLKVSYGEEC